MNVSYMTMILTLIVVTSVIWIAELIPSIQTVWLQSFYFVGELSVEILTIVIILQISGQRDSSVIVTENDTEELTAEDFNESFTSILEDVALTDSFAARTIEKFANKSVQSSYDLLN